ncbi:MAG: hypothetical protein ACRDVL_02580 [Acidimicrobiia bacterium]
MTPLSVYLRAWTERIEALKRARAAGRSRAFRYLLVLDTETSTDPSQRLLFGSARLYRVAELGGPVRLVEVREWLFYPEELPYRDPEGFGILSQYAQGRGIDLVTLERFLEEAVWRYAYKKQVLVVGFNLPFDLAHLAQGWGASSRDPRAFSLRLWGRRDERGRWRDHPYRPRITVRKLAPGRALVRFTSPREDGGFQGHFLDLHTLVFALTNERMTLARACHVFSVPVGKGDPGRHGLITPEYLDYNRRDVRATAGLLERALAEYRRHPVDLQPTRAFSPATVGKAYLRAMGVIPPLEKWPDFPPEVLGWAMTAYFGGRAECRIRHVPIPVVTLDFLSMYTTVCSLFGVWELLTADRIEVVEATEEFQTRLEDVAARGPQAVLDRSAWRELVGFAQVVPAGDVLPVRANYSSEEGSRPQIGVNPFWAEEAFWYAMPDLVGSALLTGKAPELSRAFRLVPVGRQRGLRPVRFRGEVEINPAEEDFFRKVVEERKRLHSRGDLSPEERRWLDQSLKTTANATGYGISAEMIRRDEPAGMRVYGLAEPFQRSVDHPEDPGAFCFPPFAACIAAGARLMLALLERLVTNRGGRFATCDTDAMAIVATESGGLVACPGAPERLPGGTEATQALSWGEVGEVVEAIDALHPYDRGAVPGHLLELESENFDPQTGERGQLWCLATSAKRYVLWDWQSGELRIRKASEHGLGHLLDPSDPEADEPGWIEDAWRMVLAKHLSGEAPEPNWVDRPAVARLVVSTPHLLDFFDEHNEGKEYPDQIKPFGFMSSVAPQPVAGLLLGVDRLHLVAPYEMDPTRWLELPWLDIYSGQTFRIGLAASPEDPRSVPVQTLRLAIEDWSTNPEPKSLGTDGEVCRQDTRGLLQRRPVRTTRERVTYIGKESNYLEEAMAGVMGLKEILNEYPDPERDPWLNLVLPAIKRLGPQEVAKRVGVDSGTVRRWLRGTRPGLKTKELALGVVGEMVGEKGDGHVILDRLKAFLEETPDRRCQECGADITEKRRDARFCSDRCRMRYRRVRRPPKCHQLSQDSSSCTGLRR